MDSATDIARDTIQRQQWQLAIVQELTELAMSLARQAASEATPEPDPEPAAPRQPPATQPDKPLASPQPGRKSQPAVSFLGAGTLVLRCLELTSKIGTELDRSRTYLRKLLEHQAATNPSPQPAQTPSIPQPPRPRAQSHGEIEAKLGTLAAQLGLPPDFMRPRPPAHPDG